MVLRWWWNAAGVGWCWDGSETVVGWDGAGMVVRRWWDGAGAPIAGGDTGWGTAMASWAMQPLIETHVWVRMGYLEHSHMCGLG